MNENHYLNLKSSSLTTSCLIGKLDTSVLIIYTAFNTTLVTVHQNFHPVRRPGSYYIYNIQYIIYTMEMLTKVSSSVDDNIAILLVACLSLYI